ncbi:UDP-N-acetyl-D-mannosamine dehydrogenase [Emcibacteraceae bacterium]|nr:UDP-N-acetyl-D-mannosamine dehydrogenase [Emcibacteraceae bacterium]
MPKFNKICVIGLGYIGLPTAAVFARSGIEVLGVDVNQNTVDIINTGKAHIVEADLDKLLHNVVKNGILKASLTPEGADAFLIAVPTPFKGDHEPDLAYVEAATRSIAPYIKEGSLLVLESTVPPGATEKMVTWLEEERPDLKDAGGAGKAYYAAHCPERVLPGRVLIELVSNDRIIGGITSACSVKAKGLYEIFVEGDCVITTARTAELAKLTENSFRDVNIAFANELSKICENHNVNVWELISLANRHPRVNILQPGPGVGGHCIAVDPWFIVDAEPEQSKLIRIAREVNDDKPNWVINKVRQAVKETGKKRPVIACFGLAFKPDIDDLRESPALMITKKIAHERLGDIIAVEPNIEIQTQSLSKLGVPLISTEEAINKADIIVMLVNHNQFRDKINKIIKCSIIIDTIGLLS